MKIEYRVGDLSFDVTTIGGLEFAIEEFLKQQHVVAEMNREGNAVVVQYPDVHDVDANEDEQIVINFCKARRFGKAKKVVREFLEKMPWASEGYRLYAQILMEEGEIDSALEQARIALKFNPENTYALVLIGNLLSRNKNDHKTGSSYFKRAMELDSTSPLAITNYAACLTEAGGDKCEQEKLYRRAIELGPDYLNPYYGLVSILVEKESFKEAFDLCQQGLTKGIDRPENPQPLRQLLCQMLIRLAGVLVEKFPAKSPVDDIVAAIQREGGAEIRVETDNSIAVPAKVELAKKYGRAYDRLVYRPAKYDNPYAVIHELEKHLMRIKAGKDGRECNLVTLPSSAALFKEKTLPYVTDRMRSMVRMSDIDGLLNQLMSGMCGQLMNCPLDLFVEKRIFEKYPDLRPGQILGVFENITSGLQSVNAGEKGGFPKNVVRVNRVLNAVSFMQYRALLGLDFLGELHLDSDETKLAAALYKRYVEACEHFKPGDEWDLVNRFVEELRCASYCTVLNADNHVRGSDSVEREHAESTRTFQDRMTSGGDPALNMAITFHMAAAIEELRDKPTEVVRKIAFEIAMLGCSGISPDKKTGYSVPSLGSRDMSGPQMLAYYYVSWKIAFPERVDGLGLPFADEFVNAKAIADKRKKQ